MAESKPTSSANTTTEQRVSKGTIGSVAIQTVKDIVNLVKPYELSPEHRLETFQMMMLDEAVYSCFDATSILVEKAFMKYEFDYNNNSEESAKAKEFLEWNLDNLYNRQSVGTIARSGIEFIRDGLAPFEKIYERSYGEWETTPSNIQAWKLKQLNYIHPSTLYKSEPFVISGGGRSVVEMRQSVQALKNSGSASTKGIDYAKYSKGYIPIPMSKVSLMTYSATDAQPFGQSPFEACYTAWREKILFQDLTAVGVSKDLAGTPVFSAPASILNKAATDPSSDEAKMIAQIDEMLANLHTGDQTFMRLPSDVFGEGGTGTNKEFDVKFLGVQGSGKNFDMEKLVEQRRKFIFTAFGASHLIASDSSGGYNQLEGQVAIHKHYVDRNIAVIEEAWNRNIIPQLFRLNEWDLKTEDMPKLKAGNITPNTIEEFTKGVQRVGAVGLIPRKPEVINEILQGMGIKYRVDETMTYEELDSILTDVTSKSGAGMSSGMPNGVGDSNKNNSATNSDNKA